MNEPICPICEEPVYWDDLYGYDEHGRVVHMDCEEECVPEEPYFESEWDKCPPYPREERR